MPPLENVYCKSSTGGAWILKNKNKRIAAITVCNQRLLFLIAALCFIPHCGHTNEYGQLEEISCAIPEFEDTTQKKPFFRCHISCGNVTLNPGMAHYKKAATNILFCSQRAIQKKREGF